MNYKTVDGDQSVVINLNEEFAALKAPVSDIVQKLLDEALQKVLLDQEQINCINGLSAKEKWLLLSKHRHALQRIQDET